MVKRPATFRQADLQRALRAAKGAGLEVERVEVDPSTGRLVITTKTAAGTQTSSPLDDWLAIHAHTS